MAGTTGQKTQCFHSSTRSGVAGSPNRLSPRRPVGPYTKVLLQAVARDMLNTERKDNVGNP